ncbi:arginyl-tRNA--protein transferase 1-like isoform X2 [Carica papaya]|uniref:arginyl-tRNA--protein transferase 1-like isoform X2 n=1 Tax=Carica papaya TaxID=3649 RepID=UPI000B8D0D55|nr:arginyl-tRNA--protein transferase 1-like isoform X2 [Carica papaya]
MIGAFEHSSLFMERGGDYLDRGWERSGCLLYKSDMRRTCCPTYTIRLRASDFVPSKEQVRARRRMQRFLDGPWDGKKPVDSIGDPNTSNGNHGHHEVTNSTGKKSFSVKNEEKKEEPIINYLSEQIDNAVIACSESEEFPSNIQLPKTAVKKVLGAKRKLLTEGSEDLSYSSNIAFQIVAACKRAKLAEKDVQDLIMPIHNAENSLSPVIIAEKLASLMYHLEETFGLCTRACNGHINFYSVARDASPVKDVPVVNASEESAVGRKRKNLCYRKFSHCSQFKRRKLEIHLKRSSFDPEEFSLYRRYQIKVHNEPPDSVTEDSYREFLVDTPLLFVPPSDDRKVPPCGFGSFHQQYLIDGQLVAVGVLDILPRCLSSKYLFWDPEYAFLSLGKYSALTEIDWVKENQAHCPSLQFYYLGYYVHSCSKMRYKTAYHPSELLCPLRYRWIPFDIARPLLDKKGYVVLSDFASSQDGESSPSSLSESDMEEQPYIDFSKANLIKLLMEDDDDDLDDWLMDNDEEVTGSESESKSESDSDSDSDSSND